MDLGIKGRTAVVTGGTRGLGRAVVEALIAEGCRVALIARNAEACRDVAAELSVDGAEVFAVAADLADKTRIAVAFADIRARFGAPDILVYNNGGAPDSFWDDATDEQYLEAYTLLVMGLVWCVREVSPAMAEAGWGRIVTLGSTCAREPHRAPLPMILHNIARPAQAGLGKTLSTELAGRGVTVNTIGIGPFAHDGEARTRAYEQLQKHGISTETRSEDRLASIPAGRYGRADELASLCAFVCSDRAGFITGQTLFIDGGASRNLF